MIFFVLVTLIVSVNTKTTGLTNPPGLNFWRSHGIGCHQFDSYASVYQPQLEGEWTVVKINRPTPNQFCMKDTFTPKDADTMQWERSYKMRVGQRVREMTVLNAEIVTGKNPFEVLFKAPYSMRAIGEGKLTLLLFDESRYMLSYQSYRFRNGFCTGSFSVSVADRVTLSSTEEAAIQSALPEDIELQPVTTDCEL